MYDDKTIRRINKCIVGIAKNNSRALEGANSDSNKEPQYKLEELEKRTVESISSYNQSNSTDYLCISSNQTLNCACNNGTGDVLLSETFTYNGNECLWYVWTDNTDLRVDVLTAFDECTIDTQIAGCDVFYKADDLAVRVYFMSKGQGYYLEIAGADISLVTEVLEAIIT